MQNNLQKILVIGDVHAEFNKLNSLINDKNPDIILSCGDFGFWPNYSEVQQISDIKTQNSKIYFCDGNHENHWELKKLKNLEIEPNIFYQPRNTILQLQDGRTILFFGGSESIDKNNRKLGIDWFPDENISYNDLNNLYNGKIDIVISHTCPLEIAELMAKKYNLSLYPDCISNCKSLSYIFNIVRPKLWYFGHWHLDFNYFFNDCQFYGLTMFGRTNMWKWLPF